MECRGGRVEASDPNFMETADDQEGVPGLSTSQAQVRATMEKNSQRGGNKPSTPPS